MKFSELPNGFRFRCTIQDCSGAETLADCVKLSPRRFRRLDTGRYIRPDVVSFPVEIFPKPHLKGEPMLTIVVCTNHEELNCDRDQIPAYARNVGKIDFPDGIDYRFESSFRYWNGGPGYTKRRVCLHVAGFGTVANFAEAKSAVEYMAKNGADSIPSDSLIRSAFTTIDSILEIATPVSDD